MVESPPNIFNTQFYNIGGLKIIIFSSQFYHIARLINCNRNTTFYQFFYVFSVETQA